MTTKDLFYFLAIISFSGCTIAAPESRYVEGKIPVDSNLQTNSLVQSYIRKNPEMQTLRVPFRTIDDRAFESVRSLKSLEAIDISGTKIGALTIDRLSNLDRLLFIAANDTALDDASLKSICSMTQLRVLYLESTKISDKGVMLLRGLKNLKYLSLACTSATGRSFRCLPSSLIYLDLSCLKVKGADLSNLCHLKRCETLVLRNATVTEKQFGFLKSLTKLKVLNVVGLKLTKDDVLNILTNAPLLRELNVSGMKPEEATSLREEYPQLKLGIED